MLMIVVTCNSVMELLNVTLALGLYSIAVVIELYVDSLYYDFLPLLTATLPDALTDDKTRTS